MTADQVTSDPSVETLTFLFTDIEGSTRLLQDLGERYPDLLDTHNRLLREAFGRHGAIEVGTEGDAFFVAFRSVPDAVNAAVDGQRALHAHDWGLDTSVRVRMGMHTGDALRVGDNFGGIDVHRAARIASSGHGGQVLLSGVTAQHVKGSPRVNPGVSLMELGEVRLKDLNDPEELFQLIIDELPSDFPPLRTLDIPLELPSLPGTLVPRDREIEEIAQLLSANRLVTLTGPGGIGKTRLAVESARRIHDQFGDGVFFVGLAPVTDPALVPGTIAEALHVREAGTRPILDSMKDFLENKDVLLVLDNFEHLSDAAPAVADLLGASHRLKVIATSRSPLHLSGEQNYPVPPMTIPSLSRSEPAEILRSYESIALFEQRARAVRPQFSIGPENAEVVVRICNRLDGLPLAIELAAARMRYLSPDDIATRLDDALGFLSSRSRDQPERHQTLRNTIAWSYGQLEDQDKKLLRMLGVFAGGWTFEAAEAVCAPQLDDPASILDGIESLVDGSLVKLVENWAGAGSRFVMLMTIREFALECLRKEGELDELSRRHVDYFQSLADRAAAELFTAQEWGNKLELEHDNFRAALAWCLEKRDAKTGLGLASSLWRFWQIRSHLAEGRSILEDLLALDESEEFPKLRGDALSAIGGLTYWQNDFEATGRYYEEALALLTSVDDPEGTAEATYNLGFVYLINKSVDEAEDLFRQSLAAYEQLGNKISAAMAKWGLSMVLVHRRRLEDAKRLANEALETFTQEKHWFGRVLGLFVLYQVERFSGNPAKARELQLQSLEEQDVRQDASSLSSVLDLLAQTEIEMGYPERGLQLRGAAERLREDYGGGAPPPLLELAKDEELDFGNLTQEQIEAAHEAGRNMSIEEALAFASKDLDA